VKIVLGLGNPGKKYERSRHNLGFWVVDRIASENRISVQKKKYDSLIGEWDAGWEKVLLVKPQTYMNCSGTAAKRLFRYLPITVNDLVVIYDDLDLSFGRIRIRPSGGAGGHRGVESIVKALGEEGFFRVRIGIGRPPAGIDPSDFVLTAFSVEEKAQIEHVIFKAAAAVRCLLKEGSQQAMERYTRAL
jgi:PTH1 family peptidyl-tRNA hydrolase